ncbi:MAG: hypothetical protein R6W06_07885, partial [Prochlorococcaceae cyanobacterium]
GPHLIAMPVVSTDLLALRARQLADMIQTLPISVAPSRQHERCQELVGQLERGLAKLPPEALQA